MRRKGHRQTATEKKHKVYCYGSGNHTVVGVGFLVNKEVVNVKLRNQAIPFPPDDCNTLVSNSLQNTQVLAIQIRVVT